MKQQLFRDIFVSFCDLATSLRPGKNGMKELILIEKSI
jgi:hypothetical protein